MPVVSTMLSGFGDTIFKPIQRRKQTHKRHFRGTGYQFEAEEVMKMLNRGKLESEIISLQDTVNVLKITDQLRSEWEITFPQD